MTTTPEATRELREKVRLADGASRDLDAEICKLLGVENIWLGCWGVIHDINAVTADISTALALVEHKLPGWWWSIGYCRLTNDATLAPAGARIISPGDAITATLGPDFRAPRMDEVLAKHPELDDGVDVARVGGNVPLAIIEALLSALLILEGEPHD